MKVVASLAALIILMLSQTSIQAKDMSLLYEDWELKYWQWAYIAKVSDMWGVIGPSLTIEEKAVLGPSKLTFPLRGQHKDPFEFYESADTVTLPILSLKFLQDIIYAASWLATKNYNLETAGKYILMLKYQPADRFPGGRYPLPLDALHIPHNDRDGPLRDARVDLLYNAEMRDALFFWLGHEAAHILYGDWKDGRNKTMTIQEAQSAETRADRFALTIMKRIKVFPTGITSYLIFASMWARNVVDEGSLENYLEYLRNESDHPLTGSRIRFIGEELYKAPLDFVDGGDQVQADRLRDLAVSMMKMNYLDDPEMQRKFVKEGAATTLDALEPHQR